jgi:hypothetical protein
MRGGDGNPSKNDQFTATTQDMYVDKRIKMVNISD